LFWSFGQLLLLLLLLSSFGLLPKCRSLFYSSVVLVIWSIDLAYTFSGQRVNIVLGEKAKMNSWEKANEMK
jgi:hypothetical protein